MHTWGSSATWEALSLHGQSPGEDTGLPTSGTCSRVSLYLYRNRNATVVPPSEGNEVRRDGRQGFGAVRSTNEHGEHIRMDPWEGRRCRAMKTVGGKDDRDTGL
jgi:hypothetical protein